MPDAILLIGLDGKVKSINQATVRLIGYNENEVVGKPLQSFIINENETTLNLQSLIEDSVINTINKYEVILRTRDRDSIPVSIFLSTMVNEANEPQSIVCTVKKTTKLKNVEEELIKVKAWLEHLLTSSPAIIFSCEPTDDPKVTYMSDNVKEILGYEPKEFLIDEKLWAELTHPQDRQRTVDAFNATIKTGYFNEIYRFQHKDGSYRWMLEEAKLFKDEKGKPFEIIGYWSDITEQKRIERELLESKEKYQMLVDKLEEGILLEDSNGIITFVNPKAEMILGYSEEELVGKHWSITVPENHLNQIEVESNERSEGISSTYETQLIKKDRSLIPVTITAAPLFTSNGDYKGSLSVFRDISERKKAEIKLKESEDKYREIVDNIDDGYYEVDLTGNFTFVNNSMQNILGYTVEELIGMNYKHYTNINSLDRVFKIFNRVYKTAKPSKIFDYWIIKKDGTTRVNETSISLIINSLGKPTGFRGIVRDITERKQVEEDLKRAEEARLDLEQRRTNFITMTSHELRTPLTAIRGYTDFLNKHFQGLDEGRISMSLNVIKRNINRLERLIRGVIDTAQIERHTFQINKLDIDFCTFLYETLLEYKNLLQDQFEFYVCGENSSVIIEADPDRIHQVIVNLVDNAIKHTHPKTRKIRVTSQILSDIVRVNVIDNGAGIAPQYMFDIFDQFVSVPTKYSVKGSGIGLYICRLIMTAHNGTLTVTSEGLNKGSTFIMEIPRKTTISIN